MDNEKMYQQIVRRFLAAHPKPIEQFTNEEDQMQASVYPHAQGFSCVYTDLDSGHTVGTTIFHDADPKRAIAKAKQLAGR